MLNVINIIAVAFSPEATWIFSEKRELLISEKWPNSTLFMEVWEEECNMAGDNFTRLLIGIEKVLYVLAESFMTLHWTTITSCHLPRVYTIWFDKVSSFELLGTEWLCVGLNNGCVEC